MKLIKTLPSILVITGLCLFLLAMLSLGAAAAAP
jgi:hypothetical protein